MNFYKYLSVVFCFLFLGPQVVLAQARTAGLTQAVTPTPSLAPVTTPTPSAVNLNQMLNQTSSAQSSTATIAAVAAGAFGMKAVACCSPNATCAAYCGILTAAAAGSALVAAENSGKSAGNSDAACKFIAGGCSGSVASTSASTTSTGDGSAASGAAATDSSAKTSAILAKTSQTLASVGAQVDYAKKTITTPDGKTSSFSPGISSEALSAAGLTASDLKAMAAKVTADPKGPSLSAEGVEGDGAIGVGGKSSGSETGKGYMPAQSTQGPKLGLNRDPAQVAGLTANLNGTPIGVASDSIFGIIDRRYEYHDDKGSFLPSK